MSNPASNPPKELSTSETLSRAGFDTLNDALRRSFTRGTAPACCECDSFVEPDGECPHGHPSVLKKEKLI